MNIFNYKDSFDTETTTAEIWLTLSLWWVVLLLLLIFLCVFVVAVDSKNLPLKFGQNQVVVVFVNFVVVVDFVVLLLLILIPNTYL